ncbi:MAG: YhjD/YihY/BrkB family envelope integrity protein [Prevotellaceae bacterium]|nr:YhjD/YihY/BrkB family envelope integrity protein [Prevotellaceae bacterium]
MKERYRQLLQNIVVRKLIFAIKFFTTKGVIDAASALTYSTMLSLVPICAVVFAIARGFGFTIYIEEWFRHLLSSQPQVAELIIGFVNSYLEHTKSGIILGIGLVFMLYTVVMLTRSVEQAFNAIWHAENRSNIMRTFTDYVAIFFLTPILIILMSGISMFVTTLLDQMGISELFGTVQQIFVDVIPFLLMWVVFVVLYTLMPNTRVKIGCTIIPAFLAALAMTLLQWFYIHAQMFISNYNAIYGSFAALPLFMLWVQFSWTICLFGAELCFTNQHIEDFTYADGASMMSNRYKTLLSLILVSKICRRFVEGSRPYSATALARETNIPLSVVRDLLNTLVKADVLSQNIGQKAGKDYTYQPAMSLDKMSVGVVLGRLEACGVCNFSLDLKSQLDNKDTLRKVLDIRKRYYAELEAIKM